MEVDEIQTHQLFKDLVDTQIAYGAERWLKELQRMCERFACFFDEKIPVHDPRGGYHVLSSLLQFLMFIHLFPLLSWEITVYPRTIFLLLTLSTCYLQYTPYVLKLICK